LKGSAAAPYNVDALFTMVALCIHQSLAKVNKHVETVVVFAHFPHNCVVGPTEMVLAALRTHSSRKMAR